MAIRPPPGLEIRNVDERSDVSSTTRGPLHHHRQHLPLEGLNWPSFNFHYSGARTTQWSMRSETDAAALDLDHADPFEFHTGLKSEQSILILAEIDRTLVWLSSKWPEEYAPVMPNGKKYLCVRPGAMEFLFLLSFKKNRTVHMQ